MLSLVLNSKFLRFQLNKISITLLYYFKCLWIEFSLFKCKNTKYLLLKGLFNTISTIKKEINSTLLFINLSHHRTCRLIYESFILYTYCVELYLFCIHPANRHFFPIFRIRLIASERKLLFRYLTTKDTEKYFFLVVFSYG